MNVGSSVPLTDQTGLTIVEQNVSQHSMSMLVVNKIRKRKNKVG
jgi:hypothetical protein